jgi:hypothetical protein
MNVVGQDRQVDFSEKLHDFQRTPPYERRVVAFYDILGWRSAIAQAGNDPEKIGNLRRVILQHSRLLRLPVSAPVNVSTFSDNIVVSTIPNSEAVPYFLRSVATLQLMTASMGFLLRGGIAVGDIIHDEEVVFGPALNRAYELESSVAIFPRIVVDHPVMQIGEIEGFHSIENDICFLDPFTPEFFEQWFQRSEERDRPNPQFIDAGISSAGRSLKHVPGDVALRQILEKLKVKIRSPLEDKDWSKVAWLYDRIATRLGVPLSTSYPRARLVIATLP